MGRKGEKKHRKRINAPKSYSIPRKHGKFIIRALPGTHPTIESIPLLIIIRDVLHYAKTAKEAKIIICGGSVLVDGVIRTNPKFSVGLMDVLSFPEINRHYRMIAKGGRRKIGLLPINEKEKDSKLCKIKSKSVVKGGKVHFALHDGRSIVLSQEDTPNWRVGDTLLIKIPDQEVLDHIPREEGNYTLITGGSNTGFLGTLESIEKRIGRHKSLATIRDQDTVTRTSLEYVFPVGIEKPILQLKASEEV
ncbi:MAG: 30S ribosomal protein S4e [Promethearchaeota archaeon]